MPFHSDFLRIEGRTLVQGSQRLRLRGANLGNWLLVESYMLGLPWTEHRMRSEFRRQLGEERWQAFWGTHEDTYYADADLAFLARLGFNCVQVPFNYRHFDKDGSCDGFAGEARGFQILDRLVASARRHGIFLIPGMHAAPGAQARDWNAGSDYGEALFYDHPEFGRRAASIWGRIAERYAGETAIAGWELLSEPLTDDVDRLNSLHLDMIRAIRATDRNHLLFVSGNKWGKDPSSIGPDLLADPQVVPVFHCYTLFKDPFNQMEVFPGAGPCGRSIGPSDLVSSFHKQVDTARIQRPWLCGEFGVLREPISPLCGFSQGNTRISAHLAMNDALIDWFEEQGFSWTWWALKDLGALGVLHPREDSPWCRFLSRPDIHRLITSHLALMDRLREETAKMVPELPADSVWLLGYQARHAYDSVVLPAVVERLKDYSAADLAEMARSFAFDRCVVDEHRLGLYTRHSRRPMDAPVS